MHRRVRAALGTIACVVAIALPAAQTAPGVPPATQLNPGQTKASARNFIVVGCVSRQDQGTSPAYVIADARHATPVQYRLDGDQNLLRIHVGHTVEVGGPVTPPAQGSPTPGLKVQSLTYISTTCPKQR